MFVLNLGWEWRWRQSGALSIVLRCVGHLSSKLGQVAHSLPWNKPRGNQNLADLEHNYCIV